MTFPERLVDATNGIYYLGVKYALGISYSFSKVSVHLGGFEELGDVDKVKFEFDYTQDHPVKAYRIIGETEFFCLLSDEEVEELTQEGIEINE